MKLATRSDRIGDAFYQKRIPKGAASVRRDGDDHVPVGPYGGRGVRDRGGRRGLGRHRSGRSRSTPGPYAVTTSITPTSSASTSTRSPARRSVTRSSPRGRRVDCWRSAASAASPRPRATGACTSTSGSSRDGTSSTYATPRSPRPCPRAAYAGAGHDELVEGGARRDDLRGLQPERPRPHHRQRCTRCATQPGGPVSTPFDLGRARVGGGSTGKPPYLLTVPARFAELGDVHAEIDDVQHSLEPLLELWERDVAEGRARCPTRRTTRNPPGEPLQGPTFLFERSPTGKTTQRHLTCVLLEH